MDKKTIKELKDYLADVYQHISSISYVAELTQEEIRLLDKADELISILAKELSKD